MADSDRILELRRRVREDPASIAFAQVAEECRRAGSTEEAVAICLTGLARYPAYLSARVTLARAYIELGRLDEAQLELETVVADVPENLAAIRGLAEIFQRRGQMAEALVYFRQALLLARHDPDLEDTVERISQAVTPPPAPEPAAGVPVSIEDLFDFDTLVQQLEQNASPVSASAVETPFGDPSPKLAGDPASGSPSVLDSVELDPDSPDNLASVARQLQDFEVQRAKDEQRDRAALTARRHVAVLASLESWLSAIVADGRRAV